MRDLTPGELRYILDKALAERRLTDAVVTGYLSDLNNEISDIERRLAALRAAGGTTRPDRSSAPKTGRGTAPRPQTTPAPAAKRRRRATAKNTTSQRLQGQYIGFLRQLPLKDRAEYQEIARTKGREQAIAAIRKALGK